MRGREMKTAIAKSKPRRQNRQVNIRRRKVVTKKAPVEDFTSDGTQMETAPKQRRKAPSNRRTAGPHPEKLHQMRAFCLATVETGVEGLLKEFLEIKAASTPKAKLVKTAFDAHPQKNRYTDVFCIDSTRVVLTYPEGQDDYIHANYVDVLDSQHHFICTQAPKENTVEDFWRMVWQEQSRAIIMLCNIMECGKKKCEQYWPAESGETQRYGNLMVRHVKKHEAEKMLMITKLSVTDGSGVLTVDHIQWIDWPDRGVPENFLAGFRLLQRVKDKTHIIVHCSAGIGRTGTIVGLEIASRMFDNGEKVSLRELVTRLRLQRHGSVQTDIQYVYMHRCIVGLCENKRAVRREEIEEFLQKFDELVRSRA